MNPSASQSAPLIVVAGPSGVGKTTVVTQVVEKAGLPLRRAVTATTRDPRPGETDADYHFWTVEQFEKEITDGQMLEHEKVFDTDYYGTPKSEVEPHRTNGIGVILVIDVQGAARIRELCPDCLSVFIAPPSIEELETRLRGRRDMTDDRIRRRLEEAQREMARKGEFRHVVVNRDLPEAVRELERIIRDRFNNNKGEYHA
jgi:guanylate kinase